MADGGGIDDSDGNFPISHKRTKSKNRSITKEEDVEDDRISALPDPLLLDILSFLSTKEIVCTSLLSKRWEFIWTQVSEIDLREKSYNTTKIRSFVDLVWRMLAMCNGLNKFAVDFEYQKCFASNVNLWVYFAIKKKVKDINLLCSNARYFYELPQVLYSYSSLTNLSVRLCDVAPRGIVAWRNLESLSIEKVVLLDCVMEKILSGCPVLKVLHLKSCMELKYLNIYSRNLTTLVLEYRPYWDSLPEISAPYLRVLSILKDVRDLQLRLRNVSSVVQANLEYYGGGASNDSTINHLTQLLESLRSVKKLELGSRCFEVVSEMEVGGWELPLYTQLRCLTLNVYRHEMSIFGIFGILRSSSNLETLLIRGSWDCDDEKMQDLDEYEITLQKDKCNMDLVAFHLKTVKITHFTEQDLAGEPMLTLIQVLLKSANVLEKMVISVQDPSSSTSIDSIKIAKRLLTFPRASTKAVVVLC